MAKSEQTSSKEKVVFGRFRLTVDCVVFGLDFASNNLKIVLIRRSEDPFKDCWSLPGGFVYGNEETQAAARRTLERKTGLTDVFLEQLYTFDDLARDPRAGKGLNKDVDRIVSVAYFALVSPAQHRLQHSGGGNAKDAQWFAIDDLSKLGCLSFDHAQIIEMAIKRLRGKLSYVPIGFELLERKFTLKQLQRVYEIVLGRKLESSNFRRRALAMEILEPLNERQESVSHRPALLYRFNEKRYRQLVKKGFDFEL
ncbi:MAG TPA: NUDIX domain-containing protein [Pyrinomonadaceae bacterium]|jgi:8-oxo-dGTP diphosphatase